MKHGARVLVLTALVCVLARATSAAEPLLPEKLGTAPRLEWKAVSSARLEEVVEEFVESEAPLLREYGCQSAERAFYRDSTQVKAFWVTVYTMQDRSGAYGIFTLYRGRAQTLPFGEAGIVFKDGHLFYQGKYLVVVTGRGYFDYEDVRPLAKALGERGGEQASLPSLPDYLPEGRIAGSDHYVLGPLGLARAAPLAPGDWAGFAYGAEVEAARYQRDGSEAHLLLLSYPTPQIARARLADFQQLFNLNLEGRPNAPVAFAQRKGSLIILVAGLSSKETAEQLIAQVRFQPQLSWSDPQSEDAATTVRGLLNLMLGTGLLVLLTLVLSLSFAGLRLGMKVWFPGRFLDRSSNEESLFLDIRPRR